MPEAKTFGGGGPPTGCTPALDAENSVDYVGTIQTPSVLNRTFFTAPAIIATNNFVTTATDDIYVIYAVLNDGDQGFDATLDGNSGTQVNLDSILDLALSLDCKVIRFPAIPAGAHTANLLETVGNNIGIYMAWLKIIAVTCLKP